MAVGKPSMPISHIPFKPLAKHQARIPAMEAKKTLEKEWSSLLPEILNLIAKNLNEVSDFVRFRAVCKAWRSSTPITDLPPQFPWIIVSYISKQDLGCYNISSNKFYTTHPPKYFTFLHGLAEGRMLAVLSEKFGDSITYQLSLLNPLNNHEIPLPTIDFGNCYPMLLYPWKNQMRKYLVCYVDGYNSCQLGFWQLGQNNWSKLNLDPSSKHGRIFHLKNMFFIVERETGVTKAVDMDTGTLLYVIPPTEEYSIKDDQYMAEASGDIFRVIARSPGFLSSGRFDVYQLGANKIGSPCWVKVTSIGNRALFIDWHSLLILTAKDFTGIKRNSIYFYVFKKNHGGCDVKRMDIETGAVEHLPRSIKNPGYWFVPNLHHM
ncbi:F-box SKIP23-like protein (DUF295) [Rhynchospora pubera]|uniref:F-box SKIP23-like protein (DUF295) n=1 Tax=Rhynchospora pubera TaxID=906938 RepID=A0AAV8CPA0_9POAL|nr:F-box SKIP23-like protein (DUF295) [Rhynchospora pubera]